jgi:hypothetical protein
MPCFPAAQTLTLRALRGPRDRKVRANLFLNRLAAIATGRPEVEISARHRRGGYLVA